MTLEIQVGDPTEEGRYIVYHPCASLQVREWCEPSIATWHGGRWHSFHPVWGWIGPLPVVHGKECIEKITAHYPSATEYDL
jgi:hypothetical protein